MAGFDVTISVQRVRSFLSITEWICLIVSVVGIVVISVFGYQHNELLGKIDTADKLRTRCTTAECLDAAVWLMGNQNSKVDPCEHFYDNACLNYTKHYPVSPSSASSDASVLSRMREINRMRLHGLVSTPVVPSQWGKLYNTAVRNNAYYMACIDQYQRTYKYTGTSNPLVAAIKSQLGQAWWVIDNSTVDKFNWETPLQNTAYDQNVVFFNMKPSLAPGKKSDYNLEFYVDESPSFRWATNHATFQEQNAFQRIVIDLARLLVRDHGYDINDPVYSSRINQFASDVVSITNRFENEIHTAQIYGATDYYRKQFTWSDFKSKVGPGVDFDALVKKFLDGKFQPKADTQVLERVYLSNFFYTRDLLADIMKLKSTDTTFNRKMNNYFAFRIAFYWMPYLSYEYNHIYRKYYTLAYGTSEFPADWETCLDLMTMDMPKALSAVYVNRYYTNEADETMSQITNMVNHSIYYGLDSMDWMDTKTRDSAKKKLESLTFKIGKPTAWTDETAIAAEMDRHYAGVTLTPTDHYGNVQKLNPVKRSENARQLSGNVNPVDDWRVEMYDTHVEYYGRWNEVLVPAGIIQEPLVSPGFPAYLNFGGIGTWIASAVIAAIDEEGQVLDENNEVTNWWTDATWSKYKPRKEIIIQYYNATTPDLIQKSVNVTSYAFFGIRETGGIRQAYISYNRYLAHHGVNEQALPSLSHGDIVENFFYAYAGSHCDKWDSEQSLLSARYLQFMPTYMHVDGGVAQTEFFVPAFKCAADARMNPNAEMRTIIF